MEIVPKRKWRYPLAIEREYAKLLVAYVEKEMEIVDEFLPEIGEAVWRNGVRMDAIGDWLGNLVDKVQRKVKQKLSSVAFLNRVFKQVNQHVSNEMTETIESVFGSRPRQFNNTREFETIKTIWTSQNTTLIKSIDQQIMDRLRFAMSQRIIRTADKEQTIAALAKDIQDITGAAKNRAVLIATDQVGKLNSQLTHYRQLNAGIEKYVWNTMKDSRVRPAHASREGRKFKWNDPPADGYPGWAIRCRCTALPVIDTDKVGLEPKRSSYLDIPEPIDKIARGYIRNNTVTPEMETLFGKYLNDNFVIIDNNCERVVRYSPLKEKVLFNPIHPGIARYNIAESFTHEIIHLIAMDKGFITTYIQSLEKAINQAEQIILKNKSKFQELLDGDLGNDMSISDLCAAITKNKVYGGWAHNDKYWSEYGNRENEVIANLMTIVYTHNKQGLEFLNMVKPLLPLLKELKQAYELP